MAQSARNPIGSRAPAFGAVSLSPGLPVLAWMFGQDAAQDIRNGARACLTGSRDPENYLEELEDHMLRDLDIDAAYFVESALLPETLTVHAVHVAFFWGACRSRHHDEIEALFERDLDHPLQDLLDRWATPDWARDLGAAITTGEAMPLDETDRRILRDLLPGNPTADHSAPIIQALADLHRARHIQVLIGQLQNDGRDRATDILRDVTMTAFGQAA